MNLTIPKSTLADALARAASVADAKAGPAILGCTRLRATTSHLVVTATDLQVTALSDLPAKVKAPGGLCVDAKRVAQVVGALTADEVTLTIDGSFLVVKAGKSTSRLACLPDDGYPATPNPSEAVFTPCSPSALAGMIARTLPAVATDEARGAFCGIGFTMGATSAQMKATDGQRYTSTDCDLGLPARATVILPPRGAKMIRELVKDADECGVAFDRSSILARVGPTAVAVKLMDFAYPDTSATIDAIKGKGRALVVKADLTAALSRAMIMLQKDDKELIHGIKLTLGDGTLTIRSVHPEHGDTVEEVEAELTGKGYPLTISLRPRYLRDALSAIEADRVAIETDGALDAIVMRAADGGPTLCVLMPMRP